MRQLNCIMVFCITMLSPRIVSADVVMTENFEDNTFNFTVSDPLFHDGAADYYTIVPQNGLADPVTSYSGFNGFNYFAAEDVDDGGLRPESRTMSFNVNISGFDSLKFSTLFAAGGNAATTPAYDSNDGFFVRASIDGGTFQNLLAFEATGTTNQSLRQDTDFDGVGDGFLPSSSFTAFNNIAISGTGSSLLLEITLTANDGNVEFAFDDVTISGNVVAVPEPSSLALTILAGSVFGFRYRRLQRAQIHTSIK